MTVKVNQNQLQNEITLRFGQDLSFTEISHKTMHSLLRDVAHRQNDGHTDVIV